MTSKLELISFNICPFVQRSVITLLEKGVEFKLTYIDLFDQPDWFVKISPLKKVPVLRVDETVLFESAVINEYLDDINPPSMHPKAPLLRAQHRAWVEFGSDMIMNHYHMKTANNEQTFMDYREQLVGQFQQLEQVLGEGPYFSNSDLSLVDAAFAPLLMRIELLEKQHPLQLFHKDSRVGQWSRALAARESVKNSVTEDFAALYSQFVLSLDSHYSGLLASSAALPATHVQH